MAEPEFAPRQSDSRACVIKHTARYCSSQTDQSPFCLYIETADVLICHLGPVAGKRNHSSILVCLQSQWKGWEAWAFRNYPQPQTTYQALQGRATTATSEFQMTFLAAVQGSGNCYSETAPQHAPNLSLDSCEVWDAETLQKNPMFP